MMGKSIQEWQNEITAWGASKGWDVPALCARKGLTQREHDLVRAECGDEIAAQMRPVGPPEGVNIEAVGMKLALVHSEVSEALEAVRDGKFIAYEKDGKPEGMVVELADTMIRIMHLAGLLGLDLEGAVELKMAMNQKRALRHGGKLA